MDSSPPPIFRLPAEILYNILSVVVPSIYELYPGPHGINRSAFHAVRSTCRTFRSIVDELPFWREDTFNVGRLDHYFPKTKDHLPRGHAPHFPYHLDVLLSDPHLQQCLGRKTGWIVDSAQIFRTLARHISHFGKRVRYIKYDDDGTYLLEDEELWDDVPSSFRDTFPNLTVLELKTGFAVHLDNLPLSLQKLDFNAPLPEDCGCKNDLPNLKQLCFREFDSNLVTPLVLSRILPLKSKTTLQELEFDICFNLSGDDRQDLTLLHHFKNLTILRITRSVKDNLEIPDEIFQSLMQSPFRLTTFELTTPAPDPTLANALFNLVRSPTLQNVQNLGISTFHYLFEADIAERSVYEPLVRAISGLSALETLHLDYFLHVDWFEHFRNSKSLKSVNWRYNGFLLTKYNDWELDEALRSVLLHSQKEVHVFILCLDGRYYPDLDDDSDFEEPHSQDEDFEEPDFDEEDYEEPDHEELDYDEEDYEEPNHYEGEDLEEPDLEELGFDGSDLEEPNDEELDYDEEDYEALTHYEEEDFEEPDQEEPNPYDEEDYDEEEYDEAEHDEEEHDEADYDEAERIESDDDVCHDEEDSAGHYEEMDDGVDSEDHDIGDSEEDDAEDLQ
jgi:hypothetical protein